MTLRLPLVLLAAALILTPSPARPDESHCPETGAAVRLNQLGFEPGSEKWAMTPGPPDTPVAWHVLDEDGREVMTGRSRVFGPDSLSGETVHQIDLSAFTKEGAGYQVGVPCGNSHPFHIRDGLYDELAKNALAYFYHNRAGVPIEALHSGAEWARPAGHVDEVVTCRTGRDPEGNLWPGCDYELDVTGGWYDAGDHGKYVVNGGIAVWTLANAVERQQRLGRPPAFPDGAARIPEAGNGVDDLLDEARFGLTFLLRMQAPPGSTARVPVGVKRATAGLDFEDIDASGMAHHKVAGEEWTPLPTSPQDDEEPRVLYPVSTAATLNLAATAAQCARLWKDRDPPFATRCLEASERAWAAAERNPEVYFIAGFSGSGMYGDSELDDERFWAAAELLATTGKAVYREAVLGHAAFSASVEPPAWPRTAALGTITLALHPTALAAGRRQAVRDAIVEAATGFAREREATGYRIPRSSERWAWGSNSDLLNRAMLLALAHDFTGEAGYRQAVVDVMDYLLGRNPLDRSFITGHGERAMAFPHHRFWAPGFDQGHPPPYPGALSGGPNNTAMVDPVARKLQGHCAPLTCWADDVEAYALNEVAVNWNAPLVWVTAWLAEPGPAPETPREKQAKTARP